MRRHYKPMLAQTAKTPFSSADWLFEIKWDGIRAISYVDQKLSIRSRNDKELRQNFPELEELNTLTQRAVLDGEIVTLRNGKPDFQTLLERNRSTSAQSIEYTASKSPALYMVFDILEKDDEPLLDLPLSERKKLLKEYVTEGKNVILTEHVEERGEAYFEATLMHGLEGIIAKKKSSRYEPGVRSENWLKIKKLLTCDCAIFGYTEGEGNRAQTFGALILGLYDREQPVFVGKVGTGFSQNEMQLLLEAFEKVKAGDETLHNVDIPEKITWLRPELVCEVVYQSVTREGRLRMPRYHDLRADKPPTECTLDQILT